MRYHFTHDKKKKKKISYYFLMFLKGYIYSKKCIFLDLPLLSPLKQSLNQNADSELCIELPSVLWFICSGDAALSGQVFILSFPSHFQCLVYCVDLAGFEWTYPQEGIPVQNYPPWMGVHLTVV